MLISLFKRHTVYATLFILLSLLTGLSKQVVLLEEQQAQPFACTNGKDPNTLSHKQILLEFGKGPCSPIMIIPGLFSTVLTVEIDCPVFQREHPEIFDFCGWNACSKSSYEFWKSVPHKEYRLWLPPLTSSLNIFTFHEKRNFCFSKLFRLYLDPNKPLTESVQQTKGFTVKTFGSTKESIGKAQCGDSAITDFFGGFEDMKKTEVFDKLLNKLKSMGYVPGLTYQSIPYDFRLSYRNNELNGAFEANLKRLSVVTNKKVIVLSHSLGSLNAYHQLLQLDQKTKDSLIRTWVYTGGPLLGAPKQTKVLISGNSDFLFFNTLGMHFKASVETSNNCLSGFEMVPTDPFTIYKDKDWFTDIQKWADYEKGKISYEQAGFSFLPKLEDDCVRNTYESFNTKCRLGIVDRSEEVMVKILDQEYKMNQTAELLRDWANSNNSAQYYKMTRDDAFLELNNPGVPVVALFLSRLGTEKSFTYADDVKEHTNKDEFYNPEIVRSYGDGTVPSYSVLIPAMKWAKEFDNKNNNAHPVKILELCSIHNQKQSLYDEKDSNGVKSFKTNEYVGLSCECENDSTLANCEHQYLNIDNGFLTIFTDLIQTGETALTKQYIDYVDDLEQTYLESITNECPQIIYNNRQFNSDSDLLLEEE